MKTAKTFKAIEKNAKGAPGTDEKNKDIVWEGEQVQADSTTKIESDQGTGRAIVIRFFDFGANPVAFKQHKPTAQELFNSHIKGIESLLWRDGLKPYTDVEPRLMFSKDKKHYRIVVTCISDGIVLKDTKTLSQLLK